MSLTKVHKIGLGAVVIVAILGLTLGLVLGLDESNGQQKQVRFFLNKRQSVCVFNALTKFELVTSGFIDQCCFIKHKNNVIAPKFHHTVEKIMVILNPRRGNFTNENE